MPLYYIRILTRDLKEGLAFAISPGASATIGTAISNTFRLNPLFLIDAKERHASIKLADDGSHWVVDNLTNDSTPSVFVLVKSDKEQIPIPVDKQSDRLCVGDEILVCGRRFRLCAEDTKADVEAKEAFDRKKAARKAAALKAAETRRKMKKTAEEVVVN